MAEVEANTKCIDNLLYCSRESKHRPVVSGFILAKCVHGVVLAYSGVVFASIFATTALDLSHCDNDDNSSCASNGDDTTDGNDSCRKLFGLKQSSLLTTVATIGAIILACSAMFLGTLLDALPYRRLVGIGCCIANLGSMALCISLSVPSMTTLVISAIGLIILNVSNSYHYTVFESYGPELSKNTDEVAKAASNANTWMYTMQVSMVVLSVIVGFLCQGSTYVVVVTILLGGVIATITPLAYIRLPNVPAKNAELEVSICALVSYTFHRQKTLFEEVWKDYHDYGIFLVASSVFDPALATLFVAAVQIFVSKYKFTVNEVNIILGGAICSAIVGAYLTKITMIECFMCNYLSTTRVHDDDVEESALSTSHSLPEESGTTIEPPTSETAVNSQALTAPLPDLAKTESHAHRLKWYIIASLLGTSFWTIMGTYFLIPCNLALGVMFGIVWGILLAFCWTCCSILRFLLVPGGSEAEFAGLYCTSINILSWAPLLIFTVANEVGTIESAMLSLVAFWLVGVLIVSCMDTKRARFATVSSLELRRLNQSNIVVDLEETSNSVL